ncbi:MAG: hypothetical protein RDV41_08660 [Planctomycetota bacterium]|nr:hypothetical protein [Planctomycetota bacterium]
MSLLPPVFFAMQAPAQVPPVVRAAHIIFMLGGLAVLLVGALYAVLSLTGRKCLRRMWWLELAGFLGIFIGGIPLGMLTAYYRHGKVWVWDLTDNKTLGILAFWLVYVVCSRRWVFSSEPNDATAKRLSLITIAGVAATVGLYLIPH